MTDLRVGGLTGLPINICICNSLFNDVAEMLKFGFHELHHDAVLSSKLICFDRLNIILGAHEINNYETIPPGSIIINLEQLNSSRLISDGYLKALAQFEVWDYSLKNIEFLRKYGINAKYLKFGYCPTLKRLEVKEKTIDILFYGAINDRRAYILNQLVKLGYRVVVIDGVKKSAYGRELDEYISRSRLVLNLHFYQDKIFEVVRVSYLMINGKAVVSEIDSDTEIENDLLLGIRGVSYSNLVDECVNLLNSPEKLITLENNAHKIFNVRNQAEYIKNIFKHPLGLVKYPIPKKINLGSGKNFMHQALNVDINKYWSPDIVCDFSCANLIFNNYDSTRFGIVKLNEGYFNEIFAINILEHVQKLSTFMKNCLDILAVGGFMKIVVPYDLSYGAWQDPAHVRAFNERSWLYYTEWYWYMGWSKYRFVVNELVYTFSDYGRMLSSEGKSLDEILKLPRAVDSMNVTLKKVELTQYEIDFFDKLRRV